MLIVILVLLVCVLVPLKLCVSFWHPDSTKLDHPFNPRIKPNQADFMIFSWAMDGVFVVDILVNFNAAFYHHEHLITDRAEIVMHYIWGNPFTHNTGWFWIDFFSVFPFELVASWAIDQKYRKAIKLAKLLKLSKLLRIGRIIKYLGRYVNFAMFIKHSFACLLFLHCMSCWYVGLYYKHLTCEHYNSHDDDRRRVLAGDDHDDYYDQDPSRGACIPLGVAYGPASRSPRKETGGSAPPRNSRVPGRSKTCLRLRLELASPRRYRASCPCSREAATGPRPRSRPPAL